MSPRAFRRTLTLAVLLAAASAGQALAQTAQSAQAAQAAEPPAATTDQQAAAPPPALPPGPVVAKPGGVEVAPIAAPDAYTTPGRDTGVAATLWRGTSPKTVKVVLPLLAAKGLSPAGAALARRVLATGAPGPSGLGDDPAILGARAVALIAQGDPKAAAAILARAPGIDRNPDLARAAAESALLSGDDARACKVAQSLGSGRDDIYWLRLRAYCQAIGGQADQAQLTFDLAQSQAKDVTYGRLMGAKLAGAGNPGAASLRNGLDLALSRSLGLDLAAAKPSPEVAAALSKGAPAAAAFDPAAFAPDLEPVAQQILSGKPLADGVFISLLSGVGGNPKVPNRVAQAALLVFALSDADPSDGLTDFAGPEGRAPVGRNIALDAAADRKAAGEAAMLALWACADAGPAGPAPGDRIRIVRALHAVGLEADARAFALEGLMSLK